MSRLSRRVGRALERLVRRVRRIDERSVTLRPEGASQGRVLFSYILDPLLATKKASLPHTHTHFWESLQIVETWLSLGFEVTSVSWTNTSYLPEGSFDFHIDVRTNLERWRDHAGPDTVHVAHLDTAHWAFNNGAQQKRLDALYERRGVRIAPQKMMPENRLIESADVATYLGNEFTRETYEFAGRPLIRVPVSVPFTYPWLQRDFESARRRFVWFGSGGLVHKGLDLVLEAFAGMPELELLVCGAIDRERDFEEHYRRELYELDNIRTQGWVDSAPNAFLPLMERYGSLIYPSCSEGGGSSALTCMHAGLVPIVTRETSIDVDTTCGVDISEPTVEEVRRRAREVAVLTPADFEELSRAAWERSRSKHSRELFVDHYQQAAQKIARSDWRNGEHAP